MKPDRAWVRLSLGIILVAACWAATLGPMLAPAGTAPVQPNPQAAPASISATPGNIVISQFRFKGSTNEDSNEFIEIFNRSCSTTPIDLSGYELRSSSVNSTGNLVYTFPSVASSSLGPGQYYLIGGPNYDNIVPEDAPYDVATGISSSDGGVALFAPSGTTPVDAVGLNPSGYFEGTEIDPTSPAPTGSESYTRITATAGGYVDTNNNAADFDVPAASNPHNRNSTAGTCGIPTIKISGNAGIGGVTLSTNDVSIAPVTSNTTTGAYEIVVPANWSGIVTPSKTGFTFSPPSTSYGNELADRSNQNYLAIPPPADTAIPTITGTPTNTPTGFNPRVLINEIGWAGTLYRSWDEWIELYNNTGTEINLNGWSLYSGTDHTPDIVLTGKIPAHGYYLLVAVGNNPGTATPTPNTTGCTVFNTSTSTVDVKFDQIYYGSIGSTGMLSDFGEHLYLYDPAGSPVDSANSRDAGWRAGSTLNRASMERRGVVPDTSDAWITYANSGGNPAVRDCGSNGGNKVYGTPKHANWAFGLTQTPTPRPTPTRTPLPPTPFGHMVINEFLPRAGYDWNQDGAVDVYDEFVELKNLGPVTAQLTGWKIDVISPGGGSSFALPAQALKSEERILFYGLKTHLSLYDSGGTVRLINNRGVIIDARSWGPVQAPDESHCRLPDGFYWRVPCFPTPGNENSLTGTHPAVPPVIAQMPPPCLMADTVPEPFRQAECYPFGADVYNPAYWDNQAGFQEFRVPDVINKGQATVQ